MKTSVREFGDHDGSSPAVKITGAPPSAGAMQMSNSPLNWQVNAIHFPSGDQSGSVGLGVPVVLMY